MPILVSPLKVGTSNNLICFFLNITSRTCAILLEFESLKPLTNVKLKYYFHIH
jgi:hypothetical protein